MLPKKKKKKKKRADSQRGCVCVCRAREHAPPAYLICLFSSQEQSITSLIAMEITLPLERCWPICPINYYKNVRQTCIKDSGDPMLSHKAKHSLSAFLLQRKKREYACSARMYYYQTVDLLSPHVHKLFSGSRHRPGDNAPLGFMGIQIMAQIIAVKRGFLSPK